MSTKYLTFKSLIDAEMGLKEIFTVLEKQKQLFQRTKTLYESHYYDLVFEQLELVTDFLLWEQEAPFESGLFDDWSYGNDIIFED